MSNLQTRIISAIVLGAVVLLLTWLGGAPYRVLIAAIAIAIFFEWSRMARPAEGQAWGEGGLGPVPDIAILAIAVLLASTLAPSLLCLVIVLIVAAVGVLSRLRGQGGWDVAGLAYAAASCLALSAMRNGGDAGLLAIIFLFAVVWTTDTLAYFVGRSIGGPKLAPSISPGKTRSGALGGLAGGLIAGLLVVYATGAGSYAVLGPIAVVLSIVSQAGDLFESWAKRRNGKKDSGSLIPGHGGVMDRVDGLVAAAIALYLIGTLASGPDLPAVSLFAR